MSAPTSRDPLSPDHGPGNETVRLQVELSYVLSVEVELPDGVTVTDLGSKRLHRWPDEIMEAINAQVESELGGRPMTDLVENISEVTSEDMNLNIAATW